MIVRSPKPTSRSRTRMIGFAVCGLRRRAAGLQHASVPDRGEEHREEPIEHDHHEDCLDDR